ERWKSRYKTNKYKRLRHRRRGKSDPEMLNMTQRSHRKCEYEYRSNMKNLFTLSNAIRKYEKDHGDTDDVKSGEDIKNANDTKDAGTISKPDVLRVKSKVVPSYQEQEELLFHHLFDDDDYVDSDPCLSSSASDDVEQLDLYETWDVSNDVDTETLPKECEEKEQHGGVVTKTTHDERRANKDASGVSRKGGGKDKKKASRDKVVEKKSRRNAHGSNSLTTKIASHETQENNEKKKEEERGKEEEEKEEKGEKENSNARRIKRSSGPYRGHVYAKKEWIEEEFGKQAKTSYEFTVKKKDKWGRDQSRELVLDLSMQVIRVKDKSGKTHKEHLVSSILSFEDFSNPKLPT
ncbi:hypothetical protein RFI_38235, partial [Reticulomyxa filosa]